MFSQACTRYTVDPVRRWFQRTTQKPPARRSLGGPLAQALRSRAFSTVPEAPPGKFGVRFRTSEFLPIIGFGGFFALGGYLWYIFLENRKEKERKLKEVKSTGTAKLGGNFSLVDHTGRPVTSADYKGRWALVYFGFTFCPDICPYELKKINLALQKLEEEFGSDQIVPLFVTLDPWRDSVEQMAAFVNEPDYPKKLIGLTGTPEQLGKVSRGFRVYFMPTAGDDKKENEDYLVDHSIFVYLMDRDWKFAEYYGVQLDSDQIAASLRSKLYQERGWSEKGPGFFAKLFSKL